MAKTYTAVPNVSTLQKYASADYNTYTAQNVSNLIVPPIVRASRLSTTSINHNTDTFISWTTEDIDTDGCFAPTSDTITIQTAGVYIVQGQLVFAANATGNRYVHIVKNAATPDYTKNVASGFGPGNGTNNSVISCSGVVSLAVSDTLKFIGFQSSGAGLNVGDTGVQSFLSATWIGRTS